ncbi:MAG: LuxR C-terminal-related transcriptional regulator [Vulcanimicrobiaceae bacterium]
MRALRHEPQGAEPRGAALTKREGEILELPVQGLSNKEIAQRFVGRSTPTWRACSRNWARSRSAAAWSRRSNAALRRRCGRRDDNVEGRLA